jgi:hypothetical protein
MTYIIEGSADDRLQMGDKDEYLIVDKTDEGTKLTLVRKTFSSVRRWDGDEIGSITLGPEAGRELIKALTPA